MNIAPSLTNTIISPARVEFAYGAWAERLAAEGWSSYLLTFMFQPVGGSPATVLRVMEREVERVYGTLVTRVVRHPARSSAAGRLPVWFCAPDRPVYKHAKQSLRDVAVNDGVHFHALAFMPPWSRLPEDLVDHFIAHHSLYVRPGYAIDRIDVEPITHTVAYVVGYARKGSYDNATREDASFVLPRSPSEPTSRR